jgi:hypothetical protein
MGTEATVQERRIQALTGNRGSPGIGVSNLPAGLHRKITDPHPERGAARAGSRTLMRNEVLVATGASRELNDQALAHEVRSIWVSVKAK